MSKKLLSSLSFAVAAVLFSPFAASAQSVDEVNQTPTDVQVADGLQDPDNAAANEPAFVRGNGDDFKAPLSAERFELRQEALKQKLAGKQVGNVHEVAKGQFVELGLEKTDHIFVVLVEYGNQKWTLPAATIDGPSHNQIPQPNRGTDNNTIWQQNYDKAHFEEMYFNQMAAYYRTQSSGRYSVTGTVTDWVKVPFNGSRYGNNGMGDAGAWTLIADAINIWTANQLAAGMTLDQVKAYLQQFDQWDRYDYDHDGNFNEPDGYIDHFQIVHAGAGEETGGGILGADAIWSHRWSAFYNWRGVTGPSYNLAGGLEFGGGWGSNPSGTTSGSSGAAVGPTRANVTNAYAVNHTGIWVLDYTIQPENGGLGVFAHEFGHDLGLPDQYDTAGGTNGTGFWTIMSSGSYLGDGTTDIGARPGDFGGWDKLQLGWLNYAITDGTSFTTYKLGPAETNTKQAQAVVVTLDPAKNTSFLFDPAVGKLQFGTKAYWGGRANNLDTNMVHEVAVPTGTSVSLKMQLNYDIETNWDYAYVSVSTDNGATWTNLAGTYTSGANQVALTTTTNPNGTNLGNGITGTTSGAWRSATFNVTPYAGQTVLVRVRYKTDPFTTGKGIMVDEVLLGAFADGAENGENGWTLNGFKITNGVENSGLPHYYVAEYRQYRTYDAGLQTGPYTFGTAALPNWVTHYPYQTGLLITYADTEWTNNNTSAHRGEGRSLFVDAHPQPLIRNVVWPDGSKLLAPWSPTVQMYDAPFGLQPTDALTLPYVGTFAGQRLQFSESHPSLPGVPVFSDLNSYWSTVTPTSGVILPQTGTTIRVVSTSAQDSFMQVQVSPAK